MVATLELRIEVLGLYLYLLLIFVFTVNLYISITSVHISICVCVYVWILVKHSCELGTEKEGTCKPVLHTAAAASVGPCQGQLQHVKALATRVSLHLLPSSARVPYHLAHPVCLSLMSPLQVCLSPPPPLPINLLP